MVSGGQTLSGNPIVIPRISCGSRCLPGWFRDAVQCRSGICDLHQVEAPGSIANDVDLVKRFADVRAVTQTGQIGSGRFFLEQKPRSVLSSLYLD